MSTTTIQSVCVDTGKVAERRRLRLETFGQAWAEVERIAAAERQGRLKRCGNWSVGQVFNHLAAWASYPYEGYPPRLNAPWFVRLIMKTRKRRYLYEAMPAGVKIPGIEGGTMATEDTSLEQGMSRLKRAWDRLDAGPPAVPNPIFGPLTHEEWRALNLRHAELHLGFLQP
jgi:hypothetical protein